MSVVSTSEMSQENLHNVAEDVEYKSAKVYQVIADDQMSWNKTFGSVSGAVFPGRTSKEIIELYSEKFPSERRLGDSEISKRTNDLARCGRILAESYVKDPHTGQNVYKWRVSTDDELQTTSHVRHRCVGPKSRAC